MDIYLVGGAVRDKLLNRPVLEKDWVVVGATPQDMLDLGYKPVGKDFPVFLHPKTKEEYALARTERKSGHGYTGFVFHATPDVTLKEDLKRRDLTINAIAQAPNGELIDPYDGQVDLKNKCLRHVSLAFAEDPLRVLRTARFAASLDSFTVHPDTLALMRELSCEKELLTLSPERIWKELEKALSTKNPARFFEVLHDCGAMTLLFPEILQFDDLKRYAEKQPDPIFRLCALLSDLNANDLNTLSSRIQLPNAPHTLASLVAEHFLNYQDALTLSPHNLLFLLEKLDAFRRPERFEQFLTVCEMKDDFSAHEKKTHLNQALFIAKSIDTTFIKAEKLSGEAIKNAMHERRLLGIEQFIQSATY